MFETDFIYLRESVFVYVYISTYTSTFMCVYICIYIYIYNIYIHIYIYIYIMPSVIYISIYRTRIEIARRTCTLYERNFNTVTRTNGWKQMKSVTEIVPSVARCLCMSL